MDILTHLQPFPLGAWLSVVMEKLNVVTNGGSAKAGAVGKRMAVPHLYPYRTGIGGHNLLLVEYATHIRRMAQNWISLSFLGQVDYPHKVAELWGLYRLSNKILGGLCP